MPILPEISKLVERFDSHREAYQSSKYNEAQIRAEFIDPLFKALGWDVHNEKGYAEAYKDVVHEDALKIGGATKAPDLCFRIGGTRKFFVECKKPSVNIKEDVHPAYQLRRYAWSAKLPLSILTDFDELAVYDCRIKPNKNDSATVARVMYFTCKQFTKKWDEFIAIFSRDAVLKGSFDKFAAGAKGKRGTAGVDDVFLGEIERWRDVLARNIASRNEKLSQRELNFAVQRTIDRIIFLRICEDRGIESYGRLLTLKNGERAYPRLCEFFQRADERYNSGLFHFQREKDRKESPDELSLTLKIDDKVLKDIVGNLYYPESPYEFSVLPADILGQVYEQFLGKVIRLTAGHQAKVEEKPEVRKAGGVYYTPTYIVDYIVKNTVGKLLEGKTPRQAAKLKILDPACGSGSFLLGAYQLLLDWHLVQYMKEPEKWRKGKEPKLYQHHKGGWRLTTDERKRVLLNNIYGVDIDTQAVEVTKLSLLLKVLEGESQETITKQLELFHQRALPDLGSNIKCGNSLIGPDFYKGQQMDMFDEEEKYRINAFDWHDDQYGFGQIMRSGGFDAVIGNPPYIQQSMAEYYDQNVCKYYADFYSSSMGRLNTYGLFIERVLKNMLSRSGYLSFIVPNTLLTQEYYQPLRLEMLQNVMLNITTYVYPVFKGAVVETIVFVIKKEKPQDNKIDVVFHDNKANISTSHMTEQSTYNNTHSNAFLVKVDACSLALKGKLDVIGPSLKKLTNINQAIALKHDRSASLFKKKLAPNYKPVIDGRNIQRYSLQWEGNYLAYNRSKIHSCKRTDIFDCPEKILFRRVGERLIATCDSNQFYALNTLVVITIRPEQKINLKYLLGLINSNLLNFYYLTFLKSTKKIFSEIQARQLSQLPIYMIDFSNKADVEKHDRMVVLVESMLNLNKKLQAVKTPNEKTRLKRQISATDREIDQTVYKLYGLTNKEIEVVEGFNNG